MTLLEVSSTATALCLLISVCGVQSVISKRLYTLKRRREWDPEDDPLQTVPMGWELLYGDVFRTPSNHILFIFVIANGYHLLAFTIFSIILIAIFPMFATVTNLQFLYSFTSIFNGYHSVRIFKMFAELQFCQCVWILHLIWYLFIQICFPTEYDMLITLISTAFVMNCVGIKLSLKKYACSYPCPTNRIPRPIPIKPWYLNDYICCFIVGMISFIIWKVLYSLCILEKEGSFTMENLRDNVSLYDYVLILFILILLLCHFGQITAMTILYQFNHAFDYLWWWKSIFLAGFTSFFICLDMIWNEYEYQTQNTDDLEPSHYIIMVVVFVAIFMVLSCIGYKASFMLLWALYDGTGVD